MKPGNQRQRKKNRPKRGDRVRRVVERYGGDLLRSEVMRKAFQQRHHLRSTLGDHTIRVTRASVRIGQALQKLHVPVDMQAVVVGALCHDLGMVGRREKYGNNRECYRKHPKDSADLAKELVPDLPEKTEEIIRRHMWPMRQSPAPDSIEGVIVTAADKYSSVVDFLKGPRRPARRGEEKPEKQ